MNKTHLDGRAVAWMLLCCALWGLNQVAVKVAMVEAPPIFQLFMRNGIAAVLVLAWMRHRGLRWNLRDGTLGPGALAGLCFAVEFAFIFSALRYTTAARSVVFLNTSPFIVALMVAVAVPSERLRPGQTLGLLIGFAGVAWAFGEHLSGAHNAWWGDAMALVGALLWAATTMIIRLSSLRRAPFEQTLAYQVVGATLLAPLMAWGVGEAWPALSQLSALTWALLLFQGAVVTFASYLVWFWLMTQYPVTQLQGFVLLSPVFGTGFAGLILSEPITVRLLVALAAIGLGLTLLNRRPAPVSAS